MEYIAQAVHDEKMPVWSGTASTVSSPTRALDRTSGSPRAPNNMADVLPSFTAGPHLGSSRFSCAWKHPGESTCVHSFSRKPITIGGLMRRNLHHEDPTLAEPPEAITGPRTAQSDPRPISVASLEPRTSIPRSRSDSGDLGSGISGSTAGTCCGRDPSPGHECLGYRRPTLRRPSCGGRRSARRGFRPHRAGTWAGP